jgi:pectate lyase
MLQIRIHPRYCLLLIAAAMISQSGIAAPSKPAAPTPAASLQARFPKTPDAIQLLESFPVMAKLLSQDGPWLLPEQQLRTTLFGPEVVLAQGTPDYPLLFSARRSDTWPGEPIFGQLAYEVEYYVFDPARPCIKLHIGRPLLFAMHHSRVEARAAAIGLQKYYPFITISDANTVVKQVAALVTALKPYGAAQLDFKHPSISKYLLPGGTILTVSNFSGSLNGSPYVELTLEPEKEISQKTGNRLRAFPGAEGYGAFSRGGRGGKVFVVTTLEDYLPSERKGRREGGFGQASKLPEDYDPNEWIEYVDAMGVKHPDSGKPKLPGYAAIPAEAPIKGSLREAVSAPGPRIIVFAVSGTIALKAPLNISNPFVTIAGNTAPGEGIQLRNWGIRIGTHDVVLKYLRVRVGEIKGPGDNPRVLGDQSHAMDLAGMNIVVDHCEFAYANDQIINFYGKAARIAASFQWNYTYCNPRISTHDKGAHSMSMAADGWGFISFHHNLIAHSKTRNPRVDCEWLDWRNNVLYDYGATGYGTGKDYVRLNYINSVIKPGPDSGKAETGFSADGRWGQFYAEGNILPGSHRKQLDVPDDLIMKAPFNAEPVTTDSAAKAFELVTTHGGADLPARDSITKYIAETVVKGTGSIPKRVADLPGGGYASYKPATAPKDSDSDGMPDEWEKAHKLNPNDPSDAIADPDKDGYTNIEEYINGTDPQQFVNYRI